MRFAFFVFALSFILTGNLVTAKAAAPISLAQAVARFNDSASRDPIGKTQPSLTEEEVVASLRFTILSHPERCKGLALLKAIADTRVMPADSAFDYMTGYSNFARSGLDLKCWQISLYVLDSPEHNDIGKAVASCLIREQFISSEPHIVGLEQK